MRRISLFEARDRLIKGEPFFIKMEDGSIVKSNSVIMPGIISPIFTKGKNGKIAGNKKDLEEVLLLLQNLKIAMSAGVGYSDCLAAAKMLIISIDEKHKKSLERSYLTAVMNNIKKDMEAIR